MAIAPGGFDINQVANLALSGNGNQEGGPLQNITTHLTSPEGPLGDFTQMLGNNPIDLLNGGNATDLLQMGASFLPGGNVVSGLTSLTDGFQFSDVLSFMPGGNFLGGLSQGGFDIGGMVKGIFG